MGLHARSLGESLIAVPTSRRFHRQDLHKPKDKTMNKTIIISALLGGCNNAKSPDSVANNVADAQQNASEKVADARKDAAKDNASAADKVNEQNQDLNNTEAHGAYDVAIPK